MDWLLCKALGVANTIPSKSESFSISSKAVTLLEYAEILFASLMHSGEGSYTRAMSARPLSAAACIRFRPIQPTPAKASFGFVLITVSTRVILELNDSLHKSIRSRVCQFKTFIQLIQGKHVRI